ncbi:MAG: TetR/AcrR family transcriptional regulator [Muribaculaceae bacterium]|nr:TetR/AcrR family transcriptional regulator [Muribaculaceae bacterium]
MSNTEGIDHILEAAYQLLIEKGFKATTMDTLAKRLQMSKRTLYEIFENKEDLIKQALQHHRMVHERESDEIFRTAPNLIVGLLRIFKHHREGIKDINIEFFRDMDRLYPNHKAGYQNNRSEISRQMEEMFAMGVEQGVFLSDLNYKALTRILLIHMEAIKRTESVFADDVTIAEIFDTMSLCFLRSVVSDKGRQLLDENLPIYFPELRLSSDPTQTD